MKRVGVPYHLISILSGAAILAFFLSCMFYVRFNKVMERNASDYVSNMLLGVTARIETQMARGAAQAANGSENGAEEESAETPVFFEELNLPGMAAVFDEDGSLIYATRGDESFLRSSRVRFRSTEPQSVKIRGAKYTGTSLEMAGGMTAIGVVSWAALFGSLDLLVSVWPVVIGGIALITMFVSYCLHTRLIQPLRDLEEEAASLRLGYDLPTQPKKNDISELRDLRSIIFKLAQSAIEKEKLSRDYIIDIVKAQEDERERISRDIHDGPLQDVTALVQRLRVLALDSTDKQTTDNLKNAAEVAMVGVREMREFCNNLTPPWLDLGLRNSLSELCNRFSTMLGVKIDFVVEDRESYDDEALSPTLCLVLYRVAQEAINNSARHGGASLVTVTLEQTFNKIKLRIEDNGKGFKTPVNVKELRLHGHRGLSNMSERILIAGGSWNIKSAKGKGTTVSCEVPFIHVQ